MNKGGECFMQATTMKIQSRKTLRKPGQSKSRKKKNLDGIGRKGLRAVKGSGVYVEVRHGLKCIP